MQRLDILLVELGLADTRTRAQRLIKDGRVQARLGQWQTLNKPGFKLAEDTPLKVESREEDHFVSRGALKLQHIIKALSLNAEGLTAIDVGQSTGGFTDCLLQSGASRVVGIEVGHDQLHPSLRSNERVICLEGYNARELGADLRDYTPDSQGFDLAVMDVSFISQRLILPSLAPLIRSGGWLLTLVKPQFEVGPQHIGKGGIVRDEALYQQVRTAIEACCLEQGLQPLYWDESPIKGGDGNREFLLGARQP
ncbi:TlyA family RNA methyltransferase [Marinobacterium sediminicola]|uniref:23S rRNA (Cytidine1920-2'-O)/16S rRNA (Cytidine1409-2'-O)-methyltransferase n=1 Tax=Marinobacterium sediminicola TaxID=518898 RepID=A0ABY1S364_9GAMM|nr:TlyA family RNA methyltransferase [Marinobacterium sediminicola]ULG68182.1 TlyA family RNA methyltransferase [Marinobacterium sediminicola]SMR77708.1 23S rRNA (cytidine1920-2'-O)/16S rRNA (cytidine1409-2'-O)-methyltransferase [Marinobacterium sediminicola]